MRLILTILVLAFANSGMPQTFPIIHLNLEYGLDFRNFNTVDGLNSRLTTWRFNRFSRMLRSMLARQDSFLVPLSREKIEFVMISLQQAATTAWKSKILRANSPCVETQVEITLFRCKS